MAINLGTDQHSAYCGCKSCLEAFLEPHRSREREELREELVEVFRDYARHEAEQSNYLLSGVWHRAADIVSGYVSRKKG